MKRILELMDNPVSYKIVVSDKDEMEAEFYVGDNLYVFSAWYFFNRMHPKVRRQVNDWTIDFSMKTTPLDQTFGITGTGSQFTVFATVAKIIKDEFIAKYEPYFFSFTAKEKSRIRLYKVFAQRIARDLGYETSSEPSPDGKEFMFYRPPPRGYK